MLQLTPEQTGQLQSIGRSDQIERAVRDLAWLISRYGQGLRTSEVARTLGLSPGTARYWRDVFARRGMALFLPYMTGHATELRSGLSAAEIASLQEYRARTGFEDVRAAFIRNTALALFDGLARHHGLASADRSVLERASWLFDLDSEVVRVDKDGMFFTLLDPSLQTLPWDEKQRVCALLRHESRKATRGRLACDGLDRRAARDVLKLIGLFRMATSLDNGGTHETRILSIELTDELAYVRVDGPEAVTDTLVAQRRSRAWHKATGKRVRFITSQRAVLGHDLRARIDEAVTETPGVEATQPVDVAARRILRFWFVNLLGRVDGAFFGDDPEELHKLRTSTRRLRSAFRVFGDVLSRGQLRPFAKEFRRLGRYTGIIRDTDVLLAQMQPAMPTSGDRDTVEMMALADYMKTLRLQRQLRLREHLRGRSFARFASEFLDFTAPADHSNDAMRRFVRHVAPVHIYDRFGTVLAAESVIEHISVPQLHELRIRFKELRYTLEFYREPVGPAADDLIAQCRDVQDHLGALQDAQRACEIVDDYLGVSRMEALDMTAPESVLDYRAERLAELDRLARTFRPVWDEFAGSTFRTTLAEALASL